MAKDFESLKQQALVIKNEVEDGANSSERVGGILEDMLDYNEERLTELEGYANKIVGIYEKNNLTEYWSYKVDGKIYLDSGSNFYGFRIPVRLNDIFSIKTVGGGKAKAWFISDSDLNILEESIENLNSLSSPVELKITNESSYYL